MKRIYSRDLASWYSEFGMVFMLVTLVYWTIIAGLVGGAIVADNNKTNFDKRCFEAGIAGIEINSSSADCVANFFSGRELRNLVYSDDAEERLQSFNNLFSIGSETIILNSIGERVHTRRLAIEEIVGLCGLDITLRSNISNVCSHPEFLSYLTGASQNFDVPDDDEKFYPRILLWIGLGIYVIFGLIFTFSYFPLNIKNYYAIPGNGDSWVLICSFLLFWLVGMALIAVCHLPALALVGGYRRTTSWRIKQRAIKEEAGKYGKDVVDYLKELDVLQGEVKKEKNREVRVYLLQIIANARNDMDVVKSKRVKKLSAIREEVRDKFNLAERVSLVRDKASAMLEAEED